MSFTAKRNWLQRWERHSFAQSPASQTRHTDRNTTAYIQNWISKLEEDNRLIVHAAANAQRAVDSILGTTFEDEAETTGDTGDSAAGESEESYASAA